MNYVRTLRFDVRLAPLTHIGLSLSVVQPTGDGAATNTRSIYGRPWCHGNTGIVCEAQKGSYTQQQSTLYLQRGC